MSHVRGPSSQGSAPRSHAEPRRRANTTMPNLTPKHRYLRDLALLLVSVPLLARPGHAQAAQLVGPVIDLDAAVHAAPGMASAANFVGACRDGAGNYWASCRVNSQTFLVRLDAQGLINGLIPTPMSIVRDMAFDPITNRIFAIAGAVYAFNAANGAFLAASSTNGGDGIAWNGSD